MPSTTVSPTSPRFALTAQCAVFAVVIALAELAPRPGRAALYMPLLPARHHKALDWALAHGGALNGAGPFGGLILSSPPPGLGTRALSEGTLVIAIPAFLCQHPETRPHG